MDILSYMITIAIYVRLCQGIQARRGGPRISHLLFADDALFFFLAATLACQAVSDLLHRF